MSEGHVGVLEPGEIISDGYQSLDAQIKALDIIPIDAKEKTTALLMLMYSGEDIFGNLQGQFKFVQAIGNLSLVIGNAFLTVLEVERTFHGVKFDVPNLPTLTPTQAPAEKLNPNIMLQTQPAKGGGWADFFTARTWAKAMKDITASQQMEPKPEITTAKVMPNILDYGRELLASYNETMNFYDCAIDRVYFFSDEITVGNQRKELTMHLVKLCNVICTFATTITEYRKERFGDRKVGVAAGAMWLEAAKANQAMLSVRGVTIPTSGGAISQTAVKPPRGGPFPAQMSSGVNDE